VRYTIHTPKGDLTGVLQSNEHTMWMTEHLVKGPEDVDKVAYAPAPTLDVAALNKEAEAFGERGLIRGHITGFDIMGQPGTWQDATCLMPVDELSVQCLTDPDWVHALLGILYERKRVWVESLDGAKYDVLELGGGAASSTVISPYIFEEFVAPYDKQLIDLAHEKGQRIAYHTCGGMMPFLELIADMNPDAMETFTPAGMGGDADLAEAKQRIGGRVCMIGGWDQLHFFQDCSEEAVRAEVRRCFEAAGPEGGFILAPSDHFFDAEPELVMAFADEARKCAY
jgi:uroporphyrinogen-III decarboxylase